MVEPEVAATLDSERVYGLWCWGTRSHRSWKEREGAEYRTRYSAEQRPREEWLTVPVDVTDAGLSAALVDRARDAAKDRYRKPSGAAGRFWQLRGIARCAECGSIQSPHTVKARRKDDTMRVNYYYQCRRRFNGGPRDCDHTCSYPAAALEEAVWSAVYDLLSDPERMRREMRGDPDKEARELAERLAKLDRKRGGYLDLAAEGIMGRDELQAKLAELEAQRKELEEALKMARNRHRTIEQAERAWKIGAQLLDSVRIHFVCAGPEDRRRIYQALRLRANVDREGTIRLSLIFDPDVYLPAVVQGPPLDPSKPLPEGVERHKVVVASGNTPPPAGRRTSQPPR